MSETPKFEDFDWSIAPSGYRLAANTGVNGSWQAQVFVPEWSGPGFLREPARLHVQHPNGSWFEWASRPTDYDTLGRFYCDSGLQCQIFGWGGDMPNHNPSESEFDWSGAPDGFRHAFRDKDADAQWEPAVYTGDFKIYLSVNGLWFLWREVRQDHTRLGPWYGERLRLYKPFRWDWTNRRPKTAEEAAAAVRAAVAAGDRPSRFEVLDGMTKASFIDPDALKSSAINPNHYKFPGGVEVIELAKHLSYCAGNIVKYACRAGRKDGEDAVKDFRKIIRYAEFEIERLGAESGQAG